MLRFPDFLAVIGDTLSIDVVENSAGCEPDVVVKEKPQYKDHQSSLARCHAIKLNSQSFSKDKNIV